MNDVKKEYAVVTGASSGIGWSTSVELAKRGYSLLAVSNQLEQLAQLKLELEQDYQIEVLTLDCATWLKKMQLLRFSTFARKKILLLMSL